MKERQRPSIDSVQRQIGLDPNGRAVWLVPRIQGKGVGALAGERSRTIRIDAIDVPVAHVVFAVQHGRWPKQSLDKATGLEFNKKSEPAQFTKDQLLKSLRYEPSTGSFTWISRASGNVTVGSNAGVTPNALGYLRISINGKRWLAHRLAWLYMTGDEPPLVIDHIDGNPGNNRWGNLRASTPTLNGQNKRKATAANKCGVLGVCMDINSGKFKAEITVNGVAMNLGRFATQEAASAAYLDAKRQYHAGCTI